MKTAKEGGVRGLTGICGCSRVQFIMAPLPRRRGGGRGRPGAKCGSVKYSAEDQEDKQ